MQKLGENKEVAEKHSAESNYFEGVKVKMMFGSTRWRFLLKLEEFIELCSLIDAVDKQDLASLYGQMKKCGM